MLLARHLVIFTGPNCIFLTFLRFICLLNSIYARWMSIHKHIYTQHPRSLKHPPNRVRLAIFAPCWVSQSFYFCLLYFWNDFYTEWIRIWLMDRIKTDFHSLFWILHKSNIFGVTLLFRVWFKFSLSEKNK